MPLARVLLLALALAAPAAAGPVRVERDARGVPVVRGSSRLDVARATGFLHAQERFFQMDLLRRSAAGELAEIFAESALVACVRSASAGWPVEPWTPWLAASEPCWTRTPRA